MNYNLLEKMKRLQTDYKNLLICLDGLLATVKLYCEALLTVLEMYVREC